MRNVILLFLLWPVMLYAQTTGRFTDSRDGKTYKTITIGNQVWMAENLNYDAGEGSWCYKDSLSNCEKYGKLYTWEAARRSAPKGWHLPSKEEFETLLNSLGGSGSAAYTNIIPSGSSGFNALFGGWRYGSGSFFIIGNGAYFWSATEDGNNSAWDLYVYSVDQKAAMLNDAKKYAFSVRLLKN